jgi:diguanylate cyclase (GGDEF)-like protein
LTQIANRRRLDEYLRLEWQRMRREQKPLAFILCDIDYFKRYNDTYGHQAGDECLQKVALAMRRAVKHPSDLLARYGGEEFAVILPNTDREGAHQVALAIQHYIQLLEIEHKQSTINQKITISIGISSTIPNWTTSSKELVKSADNALYEAKARGRNRIYQF